MLNVGAAAVAKFLPNRVITTKGNRHSRFLYLTFDDGPDAAITPKILKLLTRYNAKASFFWIGENIRKNPEIVLQAISEGHMVANHSNKHESYANLKLENQIEDIDKCQRELTALNSAARKIFRAPRGQLGLLSLYNLKRNGWSIVHWSYDSLDHRQRTLEHHIEYVRKNPVQNGDIVLFHDDNELAHHMLSILLPEWIELGFNFPTIEELL